MLNGFIMFMCCFFFKVPILFIGTINSSRVTFRQLEDRHFTNTETDHDAVFDTVYCTTLMFNSEFLLTIFFFFNILFQARACPPMSTRPIIIPIPKKRFLWFDAGAVYRRKVRGVTRGVSGDRTTINNSVLSARPLCLHFRIFPNRYLVCYWNVRLKTSLILKDSWIRKFGCLVVTDRPSVLVHAVRFRRFFYFSFSFCRTSGTTP